MYVYWLGAVGWWNLPFYIYVNVVHDPKAILKCIISRKQRSRGCG